MTSANMPAPQQPAQPANAPPGATGEGGPQRRISTGVGVASAMQPPRAAAVTAERRPALTGQPAPERAIVTRAQRRRARRMEMTRRQLMRASFWGAFGFGLTGALGAFLSFFWPRGVQGFGGKIAVAANLVPAEGDNPVGLTVGKFWLANLAAGEGTHGSFGEQGAAGLLAMWWKCPHLGCTVPWRADFPFEGKTGWFRCPCHGSTYTKAGVRVFGPAPRPLDTMEITVNGDGSLTVDTGKIRKGGEDNPQRTVPYA